MGSAPAATDQAPAWLDRLVTAIREATAVPVEARCLSREETARALGISPRTLDSLGADGPASFLCKTRRLYPATEVAKWITHQVEAAK